MEFAEAKIKLQPHNYNLKNFAIAFDINFQLVLKSASFDQKLHKNSEK